MGRYLLISCFIEKLASFWSSLLPLFSPFTLSRMKQINPGIPNILFLYMAFAANALVYFLLNRLLLRQILFFPWYTYCKMQNLTLRRRQHGLSQMLPLEDLMTRLGLFFLCILSASPLLFCCSSDMTYDRVILFL